MTEPEPTPDIEAQRAELVDTVDALRRKLDVQTRSKQALRYGLIATAVAVAGFVVVGRIRARRSG